MKIFNTVFFVVLLLTTGCLPTLRRPYVMREVELRFPVAADGKFTSSELEQALRIIDKTLISDGFVHDSEHKNANVPELVASYAKFDDMGLRHVGTPLVYMRTNRLEILIPELGNRSGHSSSNARRICELLEKELKTHYGDKRVRVLKVER